jgi:hypothetical protein
VAVAVAAGEAFSSYTMPGVRSEREAGAVTTGIGLLVEGGGAAGLAGAGTGVGVGVGIEVGVASLATVTRVVLQLETARRTIMAANALFMMPARSIHRRRRGTGDGETEGWGESRYARSPGLPLPSLPVVQ